MTIIDCDGHIMEPPDLWENYIDPEYRSNCIRVVRDCYDGDKLILNGIPSRRVPRLGGILPSSTDEIENWNSLDNLAYYEAYKDSCISSSYNSVDRLHWMDCHSIDISVLFPSIGLIWPSEIKAEPGYVRAHFWAYNRWILEFSSDHTNRLIPVAQVSLHDISQATDDLYALRDIGFAHIMLPWLSQSSTTCFHHTFVDFWSVVQELDLVVHLHKAAIPHQLNIPMSLPVASKGNGSFFNHVNEILPAQMCLTSLMDNCIPDKFPKIKFSFLECNAGWLPAWLDRADESFEVLYSRNTPILKNPPRYYIENTDCFFFSIGIYENIDRLTDITDRLLISTDFPHPGCSRDPIKEWKNRLTHLSLNSQMALLGTNATRLLGLEESNYVSK